jgi:SpoVK/Ycf46/Vps4 family AAA+-type ATPase
MVAGYLGQTALKTQKLLDEVEGGVLFIDEAYSLGSEDGRDSFSKEVIDTLNQNLSEKKDSLLCIIAGYKDALDKCFFSQNEGLRRRFPFVYTIEKYTADELCQIFKKMVTDMNWNASEVPVKFFEDNYKLFNNMGGDIETLFFMTKIEHGKRVLFKPEDKKKINIQDLESAFKIFKLNKESKKSKEDMDESWKSLYT